MESSDQKLDLLLRWKKFILGLDDQYCGLLKELLSHHEDMYASAEEVVSRSKEAIEDVVLPLEEDVSEEDLLGLKQSRTKLKVLEDASFLPFSAHLILFLPIH